jgi:hypothetical protein
MRRWHRNARTFLDDLVAVTAFERLVIALIGIAIMVLNTTWQAPNIT